jgi:hypothetical protein
LNLLGLVSHCVCVCKRIFSGEDGAIQKFHLVIYRFFDPLN